MLKPLADRVLIRLEAKEEKTKSGSERDILAVL